MIRLLDFPVHAAHAAVLPALADTNAAPRLPLRPLRNRQPHLPTQTDLAALRGKRLLCLVDEDNLRISIDQYHGRCLSYRRLLARLQQEAAGLLPVAVLTADPNNHRREEYLRRRGWQVLCIPRETVTTARGLVVKGNADMDLCFEAGRLVTSSSCNAVLIASGDGDLVIAVTRGIKRISPGKEVFTLAVTGSVSKRLTQRPELFSGHIPVGKDLTRPCDHRRGRPCKSSRNPRPQLQHDHE